MDGLHKDIITEILLRVPANRLARLKCTNKSWHALISHPTFVKLHLERSKKDPASRKILKMDYCLTRPMEPVSIDSDNLERESRLHVPTSSFRRITRAFFRGTCDGLVCLILSGDCGEESCGACDDIICLWNPATSEFRELPNIHNCCSVSITWPAHNIGLGYDCVANDYKVVALAYWKKDDVPGLTPVHIWARKTSTRKRVADSHRMDFIDRYSFYLKGAVHWTAHCRLPSNVVASHVLLSFSFAQEKFQELPIPKDFQRWYWPTLGILDGCLCLYNTSLSPTILEAWIMKEYGVETSWAKMFKISTETVPGLIGLRPLLTLRNGKIIVLACNLKSTPFLYDLKEKKFHGIPTLSWTDSSWFCVYEESVVSPYSVDGCKLEEVVTSPSCRKSRHLGR